MILELRANKSLVFDARLDPWWHGGMIDISDVGKD